MRLSASWVLGLACCVLAASSACGARLIGETDPFDSSGGVGGSGGGGPGPGPGPTSASGSQTSSSSGTGGAPVQCTDDSQCAFLNGACTQGDCAGGVCQQVPFGDGLPCDDGKSCTTGDHCQQGGCFGVPSCPSPDPCVVGQCGSDGSCAYLPNSGGPCDDGDPCSFDDSCFEGTCYGGVYIDCSMWDSQCTQGVCTPDGGCQPIEINEGQPCNDGLFCSVGETCQGGACYGGSVLDCAGGAKCVVGTCNEANDTCSVSPAPNGTACDDGSACTLADSCTNGVCTGAGPTVFFADDFSDNSAGWTLGPEWQIGPAMMSAGGTFGFDPPNDHTATADNGVAGVVIGGNASTNLHLPYFLESPPFDTSGAQTVVLSYWRWLNSDYDPYMHNYVQVFTGNGWVTVWMSGNIAIQDAPPTGPGWTFITHDLTAFKGPGMRVRFGFDVTSAGVYTIGSWNLDDITVAETPCP